MTNQSAKRFRQENLYLFLDFDNESYDSDDKFETQNLYDSEYESDNLDFICQNYILLTVK